MSHYRNLKVGNVQYKFNIGKRFVAIKSDEGTEHIEKSAIGFERYGDFIITPKMLRDYILGNKQTVEHYFPTCSCEGVEKSLTINPFENEIHDRVLYRVLCEDCYVSLADDI